MYDARLDHHSPEYDPEALQGQEPDDDKYSSLNLADDIFDHSKDDDGHEVDRQQWLAEQAEDNKIDQEDSYFNRGN